MPGRSAREPYTVRMSLRALVFDAYGTLYDVHSSLDEVLL